MLSVHWRGRGHCLDGSHATHSDNMHLLKGYLPEMPLSSPQTPPPPIRDLCTVTRNHPPPMSQMAILKDVIASKKSIEYRATNHLVPCCFENNYCIEVFDYNSEFSVINHVFNGITVALSLKVKWLHQEKKWFSEGPDLKDPHTLILHMNSMQTCNSVTFYFMKNSFSDVSRKWILPNMITKYDLVRSTSC